MHTTVNMTSFRQFMAIGFSMIFFLLAVALTGLSGEAMLKGLSGELGFTEAILKAINMAIVALAIFELGLVVNKEYAGKSDDHHIVTVLRRTLPRFVSIVCIALVLEGLLMVIKYSQLELAGTSTILWRSSPALHCCLQHSVCFFASRVAATRNRLTAPMKCRTV